ncbi:hypothetical protein M9H77_11216 [Catharanthus roseus]|uniref:Uncharacterized protein n=1 Tax=Catharanthus roseus TaxID=4058 RepID=A0ACC0BDY4_CATRO|nr:hypothetical protein M9H77_11216 [Catharanthus roseus]
MKEPVCVQLRFIIFSIQSHHKKKAQEIVAYPENREKTCKSELFYSGLFFWSVRTYKGFNLPTYSCMILADECISLNRNETCYDTNQICWKQNVQIQIFLSQSSKVARRELLMLCAIYFLYLATSLHKKAYSFFQYFFPRDMNIHENGTLKISETEIYKNCNTTVRYALE